MRLPRTISMPTTLRIPDDIVQPTVDRLFKGDELDIEDLAEAIRLLLASSPPQRTLADERQSEPNLLLRATRATHVMGGTRTS